MVLTTPCTLLATPLLVGATVAISHCLLIAAALVSILTESFSITLVDLDDDWTSQAALK
jgi:hypothetical protein